MDSAVLGLTDALMPLSPALAVAASLEEGVAKTATAVEARGVLEGCADAAQSHPASEDSTRRLTAAQPVASATHQHVQASRRREDNSNNGSTSGRASPSTHHRPYTGTTRAIGTTADPRAAEVQAAAEAAIATPLDFGDTFFNDDIGATERVQLDAFSPTLSANRATPSAARTMEVQLGAVTSRVCRLEISAGSSNQQQHGALFRAIEPPILAALARRLSAPPKSRNAATPPQRSVRKAANTTTIPVAQRASFRIVKELGLLGPREKMKEDVAKALLRRFKEPVSDSDIAVIAKLTHLDSDALWVMARMAGPDGNAAEAKV
ncbi:hypothetical protein D1007_36010 [Hordeum vulgare]|nr:hypothetical protein D1007_36010 [Hordeum vulgare]